MWNKVKILNRENNESIKLIVAIMVLILVLNTIGVYSKQNVNVKDNLIIIEPKFKYIYPFSEGLAVFISEDNKHGYLDMKGNIIIKPNFEEAHSFSEGIAVVKEKGKWKVIDKKGNIILSLDFDYVGSFSEGLAPVEKDKKWGI